MSARAGKSARNRGGKVAYNTEYKESATEEAPNVSQRKSGIVGVWVGHDTRVNRYFCGPLKGLT